MSIRTMLDDYEAEKERILGDRDLSQEAKLRRVAALKERVHASVLAEVQALWGRIDQNGNLTGGTLWSRLEKAEQALQQAKERVDADLDVERVKLHVQGISSRLAGMGSLDEAKRYYKHASPTERRAWQESAAASLISRFGSNVEVFMFAKQLEADREARLHTPEVQDAEATLERVYNDFEQAFSDLDRACATFGDTPFLMAPTTGQGLSAIRARIRRNSHTDWERLGWDYFVGQKTKTTAVGGKEL
ncbi:MAG: hypothetical protein H5T64_13265 [Chloroflexi bacterium]|nr:hypothetical protein [Chloroflexota bacterium]